MKTETKTCPHCQLQCTGKDEIAAFFGYRIQNGSIRPQSWCRDCRSPRRMADERVETAPFEGQVQARPAPEPKVFSGDLIFTLTDQVAALVREIKDHEVEQAQRKNKLREVARELETLLGEI